MHTIHLWDAPDKDKVVGNEYCILSLSCSLLMRGRIGDCVARREEGAFSKRSKMQPRTCFDIIEDASFYTADPRFFCRKDPKIGKK
jgi:hypothetical protein